MSIESNLKIIALLLNDIRSKAKHNANDSKALRYIMANVYNATLHEKLGADKGVDSPDVVYMSESFKAEWEAAGSPSGSTSLWKIGIHEHAVPFNVLVSRMVKECTDEQPIYDFIAKNKRMVFVTKAEDKKLNDAGYQRVMAEGDSDRHEAVGIKVHPDPILYKNKSKYRKSNAT